MKKRLTTIELAQEMLESPECYQEICEVWSNNTPHKSFKMFRDIIRRFVAANYGAKMLKEMSGQYIGYTAHHIYANCRQNEKDK